MKAIYYEKYGSTDNFSLKELDKPKPGDGEVLVKIHAASVNSWDWDLVLGKPLIYRLLFGLLKPKHNIIGIDLAGTVEAVGNGVEKLKVGDEVYGDVNEAGFGAFAEYTCAAERLLAPKPKGISFEEAAAVPHGAVMAMQSLASNGGVKQGQHILINGAGGSTGPFVLQMAKRQGAIVTCVDKEEKFDLLRSLGADHFIDYTQEDFTKSGNKYDLIINLVAGKSVSEYLRSLKAGGAVCIVGGKVTKVLTAALAGIVTSRLFNKKLMVLGLKAGRESLQKLNTMIEADELKIIIDKSYPLEQVPRAIQYLGEGRSRGKLVISIVK
jgi:NADPH:quinone reductase-like Zn-dependent oxidoreductase